MLLLVRIIRIFIPIPNEVVKHSSTKWVADSPFVKKITNIIVVCRIIDTNTPIVWTCLSQRIVRSRVLIKMQTNYIVKNGEIISFVHVDIMITTILGRKREKIYALVFSSKIFTLAGNFADNIYIPRFDIFIYL